MEKSKKRLLGIFLLLYIPILIFLIFTAIIYFYIECFGEPGMCEKFYSSRNLIFLIPSIFGILAPILFYFFWRWKNKK